MSEPVGAALIACASCGHTDAHDAAGIGVCRHPGCGCDGPLSSPTAALLARPGLAWGDDHEVEWRVEFLQPEGFYIGASPWQPTARQAMKIGNTAFRSERNSTCYGRDSRLVRRTTHAVYEVVEEL